MTNCDGCSDPRYRSGPCASSRPRSPSFGGSAIPSRWKTAPRPAASPLVDSRDLTSGLRSTVRTVRRQCSCEVRVVAATRSNAGPHRRYPSGTREVRGALTTSRDAQVRRAGRRPSAWPGPRPARGDGRGSVRLSITGAGSRLAGQVAGNSEPRAPGRRRRKSRPPRPIRDVERTSEGHATVDQRARRAVWRREESRAQACRSCWRRRYSRLIPAATRRAVDHGERIAEPLCGELPPGLTDRRVLR